MNILALDLGSKCGWALSENGRIESGVEDFSPRRGESPGWRYIKFNRWLATACVYAYGDVRDGDKRVDSIVYEMPHLRGGAAATVLAGLQTRVEEFCAAHHIEYTSVHSATLKKFTTGSGRGDKTAMFEAAARRKWLPGVMGPSPTYGVISGKCDDNQVDAICLLHYALAELIPAK